MRPFRVLASPLLSPATRFIPRDNHRTNPRCASVRCRHRVSLPPSAVPPVLHGFIGYIYTWKAIT
ncbi:hypothetical protein I552_6800 [Mycobacterium xenopi 3993]|nr:hypothetical protein I552_6800 [Mycobacterium xenopi 3993]